jgi:nitroreductase
MRKISTEDLIGRLQWRYAVKKFDTQTRIAAEDWQALEHALVLTPSSYGLQPWTFVVVQTPELRARLLPVSWNQRQVVDASHYVVFAIKMGLGEPDIERFVARTAEVRGVPKETLDGYKKAMIGDLCHGPRSKCIDEWAARQAYIALGNFMTVAALLDIDTCPMEGIDPVKYDAILELPEKGLATVVACAAGYRSAEDKYAKLAKVRYPLEQVIQRI